MARVIDAKNSTFVGSPEQVQRMLQLLAADGAAVVDCKFSTFVVTDKPVDMDVIRAALQPPSETRI